MPFAFNQLANCIVANLKKTEFDYLSTKEIAFIESLLKENLSILTMIFDEVKRFETNGIVKPHDIINILFVISTMLKNYLEANREKRVKNIVNVSKFLLETIVKMVAFTNGLTHEELKNIVQVAISILETNPKNKLRFLISIIRRFF